jgi:hypothetical protein
VVYRYAEGCVVSADNMQIQVGVKLTPEQIAKAWWNLASDEQVEFYAALDREAGHVLCLQTAYLVGELIESSNQAAVNAFRTMHHHAIEYDTTNADFMAVIAKRGIKEMADKARNTHA